MKAKKSLGMDFTQGNLTRKLLAFLIPFLLASLLNNIYNTVDMIVIGRFVGNVGTVAVSLGGKMLNMLTILSISLAGGGQILIAQQVGAGGRDKVGSVIGTLFGALGIVSMVLGIVCFLFARPLLLWMNTPEESLPSAVSYLRITSIGLPLVFGYNGVSSVLRGMGDSKNPLLFIAIAAVINLVLDLVFIVGFDLGAAGTAYATIIGQGVSLLFSVVLLYRRREQLGFDFRLRSFLPDKDNLRIIMRIGVPNASQSLFISITQLIIIGFVNQYGLVQAAAFSVGDKIIQLSSIVCQCVRQAGASVLGQNIGAGRYDRAKEVVHASLKITLSFAVLLSIVSLCFPSAIFGLFTSSAEVMEYSQVFMQISTLVYFMAALLASYSVVTMGTGHASLAFLAGFLDGVVFRLFFCFLFGHHLNMGVAGFFFGTSAARVGPILIHGVYYYSGAWTRRRALVESPNLVDTDAGEEGPT